MQGEHSVHQGDHANVAGDIGGVGEKWERLKMLNPEMNIHPTDYDFHHKDTKLTKNAQRRINKNIL